MKDPFQSLIKKKSIKNHEDFCIWNVFYEKKNVQTKTSFTVLLFQMLANVYFPVSLKRTFYEYLISEYKLSPLVRCKRNCLYGKHNEINFEYSHIFFYFYEREDKHNWRYRTGVYGHRYSLFWVYFINWRWKWVFNEQYKVLVSRCIVFR